jgi:microcystin-dependent protein
MSTEPLIGSIGYFAGNFAPEYWALCDGRLLTVSQYQALFAIIGPVWGGDGRTTFALPDLRPRDAMGRRSDFVWGKDLFPCIALQGVFPTRD